MLRNACSIFAGTVGFLCVAVLPAQEAGLLCNPANRWAFVVLAETSANDPTQASVDSIGATLRSVLELTGFPQEQIVVLQPHGQDARTLPTRDNISAILQWIHKPESQGPLPHEPKLRQVDEACEVFVYLQILGVSRGGEQYLCPLLPSGQPASPDQPDTLLLASDVLETLATSPVERRFCVMNILSPVVTRGNASQPTWDGVDSKALLRDVTVPLGLAGFGQVIVNDQLNPGATTVDGFANMLQRGLSGYADSALQGNRDRHVSLRELTDYLEYYGNRASAGSVKTLFIGHDYPMARTSDPASVADGNSKANTRDLLERVGVAMLSLQTGATRTPNYEIAVDSFVRAAVLQGSNYVVVQPSRTARLLDDKGGRTGRRPTPSDSLRLTTYEQGWFRLESGWIRAEDVVSLQIVEQSPK